MVTSRGRRTSQIIENSKACSAKQRRINQSSVLLALCEWNPVVIGGFTSQSYAESDSMP